MTKKKSSKGPEAEKRTHVEYDGVTRSEPRWGYGFERHGAKWRSYKTGEDLVYLSPDRGEELHSAVAKIQAALAKEITTAIRTRGKS